LDKAIDIKRRAQRHIQSGNLDAALEEYEKLARAEENEPYHAVVIADLLFKKGAGAEATRRYLQAVEGYDATALYKNAIAVCKKMVRLGLAQGIIFKKLAELHQRDGLATEAALFFMQYAEYAFKIGDAKAAADSLTAAYEASPENIGALERLADIQLSEGNREASASTLERAIEAYERQGMLVEANRCRSRQSTGGTSTPSVGRGKPPVKKSRPDSGELRRPPALPREPVAEAAKEVGDEPPALSAPPENVSERPDFGLDGDHPLGSSDLGVERTAKFRAPTEVESLIDRNVAPIEEPRGPAAPEAVFEIEAATPPAEAAAPAEPVRQTPSRGMPRPPMPGIVPATREPAPAPLAMPSLAAALPSIPMGEPVAPPPPATRVAAAPSSFPAPPPMTPPAEAARPGLNFDGAKPDLEELFRGLVPDAMAHPEAMQFLLYARQLQRADDLVGAADHMLKVAEVHDLAKNYEAAARVFRALEHMTILTPAQLVLWFENAGRRGDAPEASRVACQMGDRALQGAEPAFARDWFQRAASLDPNSTVAQDRLRELATGRAILGSSAPASADETVLDPFKLDIIYGVGEVQIPLDEIVDRFQAGVQDQVSDDAESQYALGVSFLEMGLPEQAMEALRASANSPQLRGRAAELVGRCLMDLGRFEEAVQEFRTTLADPKLDPGTMLGVRFELGLALEAAGRADEALAEFEHVHQARPSYPEAATKIRSLRQSLESR
jgi:tetratricopeptide (TPR) repeat protein